jgi:hypothetical protein
VHTVEHSNCWSCNWILEVFGEKLAGEQRAPEFYRMRWFKGFKVLVSPPAFPEVIWVL